MNRSYCGLACLLVCHLGCPSPSPRLDGGADASTATDASTADAGVDAGNTDAGNDAGFVDAGCLADQVLCGGRCVQAPLPPRDGGCDAGLCNQELLASGQLNPAEMALGECGGWLVWTNSGSSGGAGGSVMYLGPDGGAQTLEPAQNDAYAVAVGPGFIAWGAVLSGTIQLVSGPGQAPQTLAEGQAPLALVADSNALYWQNGSGIDAGASIMRLLFSDGGLTALASGQVNLQGNMTGDDRFIYWTDSALCGLPDGGSGCNGTVMRAAKDGTGVTALALGQGFPTGIAVDSDFVYWDTNADGFLWKVAKDGGTPIQIVATEGPYSPFGVAVDSTYVYWTERSGNIRRAPLDGGASQVIGSSDGGVADAITVDDNYVYWMNQGQCTNNVPPCSGAVFRVHK